MKMKGTHISAFTVMEIVMVLAIMGILITLVFTAINRFQQQAHINNKLHEELNQWYKFRALLWSELYELDSAKNQQNGLVLYSKKKQVFYQIENDTLYRSEQNKESVSTGFEMVALKIDSTQLGQELIFEFQWKGEPMNLSYLHAGDRKRKIDQYFNRL